MSPSTGRPSSDPLEPRTDETLDLLHPSGTGSAAGSRRQTGAPAWPEGAVPVFAPGEEVAGRFRVVRFIAQGGMGQVYEAEDLELHENVALKTVRAEIANEERALVRFKREVHLARKVTHENVCRIYDVFRHTIDGPAAERRAVLVLAMELLSGETLAARLKREGPMAPEAALPLVAQMAEGLAAAHRAGVVHRDFNPKNVMLAPAPGEPGGVRAVVTDFGLAHVQAGEPGDARHDVSVTAPGMAAGTPAYMSPEQVEGADLTGSTDVYALGIVIFEMLTGHWPFVGANPLSTAVKRLQQAPPSPRLYAPDVDPRWEAVILKCLERRPEDRFASALDVPRALAAPVPDPAPPPAAAPPPRLRRARLAAGVALLLLLAGGAAAWLALRPRAAPVVPAAASRTAFAVLGFKNVAERPEMEWLATAFSEMLETELAAGRTLRAIPAETVARAKAELELGDARSLAPDSLAQLKRILGADLVILGSYSPLGSAGEVRLDVRLQSAATGETLDSFSERGTEAELEGMVLRAGGRLREHLGVAEPSGGERRLNLLAALPTSPEAARFYADGLAKLRAQSYLEARDLLERAVEVEPGYPLAHSALARAWSGLGYDARAEKEARQAFERAERLPREERLLVEAQYREVSGAWAEAVEIYRKLWELAPDQLEHGLSLARAEIEAGRSSTALSTIAELRKLPAPLSTDPRIDLREAEAAGELSDHRRQREAAARAVTAAREQGARLLVAEGRALEGGALRELGLRREALAVFDEAERIYRSVGDRGSAARMLSSLANVRAGLGELDVAQDLHERSLAIQREIGDQGAAAAVLNNLGLVHRRRGDLAGAARAHQDALDMFREIGQRNEESKALSNLANVLADQGALSDARDAYERSLAIKREIGDKGGVASVLGNVAELLTEQGSLAEAQRLREEALGLDREVGDLPGQASDLAGLGEIHLLGGELGQAGRRHQEALDLARRIGERSLEAWALFGLGNLRLAAGDLAAAADSHQEALELRTELEEGTVAESRLALAAVALEQGDAARAEELAREAEKSFAAEGRVIQQAAAHQLLAQVLLARGDLDGASKEAARASELSRGAQSGVVRLRLEITAGRVAAARGQAGDAQRRLRAAMVEAKAKGLAGLELEARLALAEAEERAGKAAAARARRAEVERDAKQRGFGLLARRAAGMSRASL